MYYLVLVHAFSCLLWTWWYACSIHAICTWTLRPSLSLHRLNSLIFSYRVPWRQCPEVRFCVFFLHTPLFSISVPLGLGSWTFRMYYIYIQIYIYIIIIYLCPVKVYQTCPGSFYRSHWKTTWYPIEEPCSCLSPRMHVTFWPTFTYVVCINLFGYHMCTYHMYIHDHTCKIR